MIRSAVSLSLKRQAPCAARMFTSIANSSDPLHLLQHECQSRGLCDDQGRRLPDVDWRMVLALGGNSSTIPPNVRTISIERLTSDGIDFVVKKGGAAAEYALQPGHTVAFLHTQGQFLPGQSAEQWRGEGACVPLDLELVLPQIPLFTLTSLVASQRLRHETHDDNTDVTDLDRVALARSRKSHFVSVLQTTRRALESHQVPLEELQECVQPLRLPLTRVECMLAGPDASVMWDRWEWQRASNEDSWQDPRQLVPH